MNRQGKDVVEGQLWSRPELKKGYEDRELSGANVQSKYGSPVKTVDFFFLNKRWS